MRNADQIEIRMVLKRQLQRAISVLLVGSPRQRSLGLLLTPALFYHLTVRLVIWFQSTFLIIQWKRRIPTSEEKLLSFLTTQISLMKAFVGINQTYINL